MSASAAAGGPALLGRIVRNPGVRRLASFTVGSGFGLVVDVGGYALLNVAGLQPGVANAISSLTSIVVVYLFVTRRTFAAQAHAATFLAFLAWYGLNVLATSATIQVAVTATGGGALLWKLALVPVSFAANYGFNLALHGVRTAVAARRATPGAAGLLRD